MYFYSKDPNFYLLKINTISCGNFLNIFPLFFQGKYFFSCSGRVLVNTFFLENAFGDEMAFDMKNIFN